MATEPAYRPVNHHTVSAMPAAAQAEIARARTLVLLDKATQHQPARQQSDPNPNHAHLQKASNQDRAQAALSPTDGNRGQTAIQVQQEGAKLAKVGVSQAQSVGADSPTSAPPTPPVPGRDSYRSR